MGTWVIYCRICIKQAESVILDIMLRLSKVTKKFGNLTAVNNLSFEVKKGEIYALLGANGSGKTTTLKLIADIYKKNAGEIYYDGRLGYIPDEPIFYPGLTGYETVNFITALYKIRNKEKDNGLQSLLKVFPITDVLHGEVESYSRGNKQKLSIITQFIIKPDLLLIDEPIVGLDPPSAHEALTLFNDYASRGGLLLLCTHTLSVVEEIADRAGFLKEGKLVGELTKRELKDKDIYAAFVGITK